VKTIDVCNSSKEAHRLGVVPSLVPYNGNNPISLGLAELPAYRQAGELPLIAC
jgi:hypothetical protein